jgi:hypothetical protein
MNNIQKLKDLVEQSEVHATKLYEKNIKISATKLRGIMQEIKKVSQEIRVEALSHQHDMPTKKRAAAPSEPAVDA